MLLKSCKHMNNMHLANIFSIFKYTKIKPYGFSAKNNRRALNTNNTRLFAMSKGKENDEVWKDIIGTNGMYQISNKGRARSWRNGIHGRRDEPRILSLGSDKDGYKLFRTSMKGDIRTIRVHRCVLKHFVGNQPKGYVANHKDGDKSNNKIDNLEWCTVSENTIHAFENGLRVGPKGEASGLTKFKREDVKYIREKYDNNEMTQRELAEKYDVNQSTISRICSKENWSHVS